MKRKPLPTNHPYPNFARALLQYGADSVALSAALGVSQRSAYNYLRGDQLPDTRIIFRYPALVTALALDFASRPPEIPITHQKPSKNLSEIAY